ncbi:hypothetical protein F5Y18DRAFT_127176 [Xylariaceae sp. FL1019]|nr:hypothetical protein F5Y18DRAFT_127176 [Xylariaceae sp. FL1019]
MAHNLDADKHKRKRDIAEDHPDRIPQPPPPSGNNVPINYLTKAQAARLKLIQGDGDTFSDVLGLITEYEGVLSRHESLAFNLGAKLTGTRLLKAMEGAFEGSITTTPPQSLFSPDPVNWLDIVSFAKSNPQGFQLSSTPSGLRYCGFLLKGLQVEISEDDWRLIKSGALERFRLVPPQPLDEDEAAELATLEIIEQRLQILIKKADEVARRARQLNYHLSGRKASIHTRHPPQSGSSSKFQSVNIGQPSSSTPGYDVHADLLQQFTAPSQPGSHRLSSVGSLPPTPNLMAATTATPRTSLPPHTLTSSARPSPTYAPEGVRDTEEEYRVLVTSKIEQLTRGDIIRPPCDRCRRLKTQCIKHLTACQGCTKKHTKCTWKKLTEEELAWLNGETSMETEEEEEEPRETTWRNAFATPPQPPGLYDLRGKVERPEDTAAGPSRPGLVLGRHHDDVWRKDSTASTVNRDEAMDIDSNNRARYSRDDNTPYAAMHGSSVDPRIRQVASAASARADAAAASRENPPHR